MIGYNSPDVGRVKIARPVGVFGAAEGAVGGAAAVLALYLGGALADAALAAAWARFCAAVHAAAD